MITDPANGNRVNYIPVNLQEGDTSAVITLTIAPESEDASLGSNIDARASVLARIGVAAFQNIGTSPLDLSAYTGGASVNVDFKVVAATPLPGVNRVLLSAGIRRPAAAAWLN